MKQSVRTRRGARGFSFVELLVTIIIAGIAFAAMVPLFVRRAASQRGDKARSVALNLAQDRIEKLRQLDFELITSANLNDNSFYFGEFGSSWTEADRERARRLQRGLRCLRQACLGDRRAHRLQSRHSHRGLGRTAEPQGRVLTTMIYRQYSGPEMVDFSIPYGPGAQRPADPGSEPHDRELASAYAGDGQLRRLGLDGAQGDRRGADPAHRDRARRLPRHFEHRYGFPDDLGAVHAAGDACGVPRHMDVLPGRCHGGGGRRLLRLQGRRLLSHGLPGQLLGAHLPHRDRVRQPPVTNLAGTAGLTTASLTWNASTTGDVDHYLVKRDGVDRRDVPKASGSMGYTDSGLDRTVRAPRTSTRSSRSTGRTTERRPAEPGHGRPGAVSRRFPPAIFRARPSTRMARLTWVASPEHRRARLSGVPDDRRHHGHFTTARPLSMWPRAGTRRRYYQVKPYVGGGVLSTQYGRRPCRPAERHVGGVAWLQVDIGAEPRYTLVIKNTTNKTLTSLRLYYLGADGHRIRRWRSPRRHECRRERDGPLVRISPPASTGGTG